MPGVLACVADYRRTAKRKGPSDKQTAPGEEGMHPNLAEHLRKERRIWAETKIMLNRLAHRLPGEGC